MEKYKQKRGAESANWLMGLFAPAVFDFVAYLPLDECVHRLQSLQKPAFRSSPDTIIVHFELIQGGYKFRIARTGRGYGQVEAEGNIQDKGKGHTRTIGEVTSYSHQKLKLGALIVWLMITVCRSQTRGGIINIFLTFGLIVDIAINQWKITIQRNALAQMIEDTLGR